MHENGGFGAAPGHDAHMLYTVSAVQILASLDAFDELEQRVTGGREKIAHCRRFQICILLLPADGCSHFKLAKP